jgi:flagellar hook-associated protein 2
MAVVNFSGLASGIDSAGMIEALMKQKRNSRLTPLERKKNDNESAISSIGELKTLLNDLKVKAESFRTLNGGGVKKGVSSSDEKVASTSIIGSAKDGVYELTVDSLARNGSLSLNTRFNSEQSSVAPLISNTASAVNRTVSFEIGNGSNKESISIELNSSTSVLQLVEKFNSLSTKAVASLVNVGNTTSPSYAFSITTKEIGSEKGNIAINIGAELSNSSTLGDRTLRQATDARITIAGIQGTITRSSNTINDIVSGVSVQLNNSGSTSIKVASDKEATLQKAKDFVESYNKIISFIDENNSVTQKTTNGEVENVFASLNNTRVDDTIKSTLRSTLSNVKNNQGDIRILADLGITTKRDGTLGIDEAKFNEAVGKSESLAGQLLEKVGEKFGSVDGIVAKFTQFQGIIDSSVKDIDKANRSNDLKIADIERSLSKEKERLNAQFARLESTISQLNSQQSSLQSLLGRR